MSLALCAETPAGLLDQAAAAPPELAAQCLLRAAGSDERLLEDAFELAARSRYAARKQPAVESSVPTLPHWRSIAMRHGLDRTSLQSEAVRAMLAVDAPRAMEMFSRMRVEPAAASCDDAVVDDVSAYYRTATEVLASVPPADRIDEMRQILARVTSPVELAPAATMIVSLKLSGRDAADARTALGFALARVDGDDRSFRASLEPLDAALQALGPDPALLKVYRAYVARHVSAPRCAEGPAAAETRILDALSFEARERRAAEMQGSAKVAPLFEHYAEFSQRAALSVPAEGDAAASWTRRLEETVRWAQDLAAGPRQSDAESSLERTSMLFGLCSGLADSPQKDTCREQLVSMIENSPLQFEDWVVWYDLAANLIESDREPALRAFAASRNPQLALIAQMERLLAAKE